MAKRSIIFKPDLIESEFFRLHPSLIEIVGNLLDYCLGKYKLVPSVTSIIRPKTDDSGVHETGRAIDLSRHMHDFKALSSTGGYGIVRSIPEPDCHMIAKMFNAVYPRPDDIDTVLWHNNGRGGWHFHVQVPFDADFAKIEEENVSYAQSKREKTKH